MDIIGAGGHAKVVIDTLQLNHILVNGIWADNMNILEFIGIAVKGDVAACIKVAPEEIIIGIGNNIVRKRIAERFKDILFGMAIHPNAVIAKDVQPGAGTVMMANCGINIGTRIGRHVIINTSASVDHDCIIGDYVHISPQVGLAGGVEVGAGTHIGIGACVIQGIKIGSWCTIGAGAVIIRDVPDGATVVGNPGKIIKMNP